MLTGAQNFAEVLGEELGEAGEPPTLSLTVIETQGTVTIGGNEEFIMQAGTDPWQDEDTRTFYTSLPDLKVFMPNSQMKEVNIVHIYLFRKYIRVQSEKYIFSFIYLLFKIQNKV